MSHQHRLQTALDDHLITAAWIAAIANFVAGTGLVISGYWFGAINTIAGLSVAAITAYCQEGRR